MNERTECADTAALLDRWRRIEMFVRCGLAVRHVDYVRLYVHIGARIARRGLRLPGQAQRQMLRTLLRTAQDVALPWPLRRACLDQATPLLAQLRALAGLHDPVAVCALEAEVRRAVEVSLQRRTP